MTQQWRFDSFAAVLPPGKGVKFFDMLEETNRIVLREARKKEKSKIN